MRKLTSILVATLSFGLFSCGKGTGTLTFVASNTASSPSFLKGLATGESPSISSITEFKVCIKKVKLENEDGEAERGESEEDEIEFKPGLVDLSNVTSAEATIGSLENAPVGFKISKIKIKVRKDSSLCGQNYSIKINNGTAYETDDEIEFKWKFNPPVELAGGDTLQLAFNEFVTALQSISSNTGFATAIPNAEGTARIKNR